MPKPESRRTSQQKPQLLAAMRKTIKRFEMFALGDHVVVGVSGGADSVALLHALRELAPEMELRLTVAHLNHGLRGDAALRESDFVKNLSESLGLPCACEKRTVHTDKNASRTCLQEAARTVRYRFFSDVLTRCGAQKLALGHTMDDQAETVLMRLLRGASTPGLGGIPPVREGGIVRPLINVRRSDVERFLQDRCINFVPDTSVHEPQYLRNRIRHELIPMLAQQYNPRVIEALCTTANLARDDDTLLQDAAADIARTALQPCNGTLHIPVKLLEDHPALAGRIVRRCVELLNGSCRGLTSLHTEAVLKLLKCTGSNKQIPLTGGLVARREYDTLFMGPASLQADFHIQVDTLPADVPLPQAGLRILLRSVALKDDSMLRPDANSDTVHLNPDSIALPLIIRTWRPGDRMQPFGFDTVKKVKAVFADNKVPVRLRGLMPLIESDGRIISVGTLRIAEHCRVNPSCPEVIELTVTSIDRQ